MRKYKLVYGVNHREYWTSINKSKYVRLDFKNAGGDKLHIETPFYTYEIIKSLLGDPRFYDFSIDGIKIDYIKSTQIFNSNVLIDREGRDLII